MFGQAKQIAEGFYNDITKKENELHDERMKICKECSLYSEGKLGPYCDKNKEVNNVKGCNCLLDKKTRVKSAKCVLGKW